MDVHFDSRLKYKSPKLIHLVCPKTYKRVRISSPGSSVQISTGIFDTQFTELKNNDRENEVSIWNY